MSTKVDLERLAATLDGYTYAYLMTIAEPSRPHAVAVRTELVDEILRVVGLGRRSRANALARPVVSLVYPPSTPDGYSLIVDGEATVRDDDLVVIPTVAVLHRPSTAGRPASRSGCTSDCRRLEYDPNI